MGRTKPAGTIDTKIFTEVCFRLIFAFDFFIVHTSGRACFDPCSHAHPQEKHFEIANGYILALGSHGICWSFTNFSLLVAQQMMADAVAHADDEEAAAPGTDGGGSSSSRFGGVSTAGGARGLQWGGKAEAGSKGGTARAK